MAAKTVWLGLAMLAPFVALTVDAVMGVSITWTIATFITTVAVLLGTLWKIDGMRG